MFRVTTALRHAGNGYKFWRNIQTLKPKLGIPRFGHKGNRTTKEHFKSDIIVSLKTPRTPLEVTLHNNLTKTVKPPFVSVTLPLFSSRQLHISCLIHQDKIRRDPQITRSFCIDSNNSDIYSYSGSDSYYSADSGSESESEMTENRYLVAYAKLGTSSCKKCKVKIEKGALRIAKLVSNPFSEDAGDMKQWFHPQCVFETFVRARATTKKIEDPEDVEGFADLKQEDKDVINNLIKDFLAKSGGAKKKATPAKAKPKDPTPVKADPVKSEYAASTSSEATVTSPGSSEKDDSFREFRRLCAEIAEESAYTGKTAIVHKFIMKGSSGDGYHGNLYLLIKLLLPGTVKRVYNLNNKQLVKLYSQAFHASQKAMLEDLEQGDVAETVRIFFEDSHHLAPQKKCTLTIQEVDSFLENLSNFTKEDDQERILTVIAKRCTSNDLKMFIRLIKHDLRINSGAKHILDALDANAYAAFQASRDLRDVIDRVLQNRADAASKPGMSKKLSVRANLMTPVLPMLAEACRSVQMASKKCPNGFYAEIKYDGERVQVHKRGSEFQYFSRSLKPVLAHKVAHFKDHIPKAFPSGDDLILDAEVLLIDTNTGNPLPFGSLGVHKREKFQDANVCLFVFDCLHINGENIMDKPIKHRRRILRENMTEIPNRILFSEMKHIKEEDDLTDLMNKVFKEGLEGLVLKDVNSLYEPGKRHWLKVKKDYLLQGSMADSADLVVLGAFHGTGNKGGMMSVFLMGVYDAGNDKWCTVSKVGNGFDDATLDKLQTELGPGMEKISKNISKVPSWMKVTKQFVPDYVVKDPFKSPVWEISGAEFSKSDIHTADGISIRFPRVTKVRDDKSWKEATDLDRLKQLFKKSKDTSDFNIPGTKNKSKDKLPMAKSKSRGSSGSDTDENSNGSAALSGTPSKKSSMSSTPTKMSHTPTKTAVPSSPSITKYFSPKKEAGESPAKAVKRSSGSPPPGESPAKKKKPECTYGADCYQKNPEHREKYYHAPKVQQKSSNGKLPDIFSGAKIFLPEKTENFKKLKRYIIAFDGETVPEFTKSTATHVIVDNGYEGDPIKCEGVCVKIDWLWKCIKNKTLVPTDPYIVK